MINLYIKEHSLTGLKYFGKTVQNPFTYKGSGVKWKRHYRKYGFDHVLTTHVWSFNDPQQAKNFAVEFSKENNIVDSDQWANLIVEQLDGGDTSQSEGWVQGMKNRPSRKGIKLSEETKRKMRKPKHSKDNYKNSHLNLTSAKNTIYINNGSEQRRVLPEDIIDGWQIGKLQFTCHKCEKTMDIQNFKKYHSNC